MDLWIKTFRNAKTIAGEDRVYIPGDIEREIEIERMHFGIPIVESVIKELENLASKFKVRLPKAREHSTPQL